MEKEERQAVDKFIGSVAERPEAVASAAALLFGTLAGGPTGGAGAAAAAKVFMRWLKDSNATEALLAATQREDEHDRQQQAQEALARLVVGAVEEARASRYQVSDELFEEVAGQVLRGLAELKQRSQMFEKSLAGITDPRERRRRLLETVSTQLVELESAESEFRDKVARFKSGNCDESEVRHARRALVDSRGLLDKYAGRLVEEGIKEPVMRYVEADERMARALYDHRGGYRATGTELEDCIAAYNRALGAVSTAIRDHDAQG